MILCQKDATVHSPSYCILLPERAFRDKKKRRYYLFFRRWGRFARNVPSGEERGETDVFAGHVIGYSSSILPPLQVFVRHLPSGLTLSKQKLISSSYLLVIKICTPRCSPLRSFEISGNRQESVFRALWLATQTWDIQCFSAVRATPNSRRTNGFPACCRI